MGAFVHQSYITRHFIYSVHNTVDLSKNYFSITGWPVGLLVRGNNVKATVT